MDKYNLFYTRTDYNMVRADYAVVMLVLIGMVAYQWESVRWLWFFVSFAVIDVIGTFPGIYWYYFRRTGKDARIPKVFHLLYNITHSFSMVGLATLFWYLLAGGWEWAMLAMPIHLCGDRSVFGNIYKPYQLAFEPRPHEGFQRFYSQYARSASK